MPAAVAFVGVVISFAVFVAFEAAEAATASDHLTDTGREIVRDLKDLQAIALEQLLAIQAFYESSGTVTAEEFAHFVEIVGGPADNQLAYAHRVTDERLDAFLALARTSRPDFTLSGQGSRPGRDHWILLHSSKVDDIGYLPGFDFGSDPAIRRAIDSAFNNNRPVASSFVDIPSDIPGTEDLGEVAIVSPIHLEGAPVGVAVVTMRLDELLTGRLHQLLGDGGQLTMSDTGAVLEGPGGQRANRWVATVPVVGREIRLTIDVAEEPSSTSAAPWLLVLGVGMSLLAGVLIHDRSRRRSMTRQVARLQQTLAEKDRFLASVSHELRTPLTAVVGIAEILASRVNNFGKEDGALIQDVRTSAQELETLVEDHLTSARLTAGALTVNQDQVDLAVIVARAIAVTERPNRLSIRISELSACIGDPIRVRQIVRNLLNNSYRYAASRVEIQANDTSEQTVIEFLNDGPPVSTEVVGTMFEPFVKGQRPGQPESIGLGLSVSRKLAQRMGGDLVYVYKDGFVKFSLSLPAAIPRQPVLRLVEPFAS